MPVTLAKILILPKFFCVTDTIEVLWSGDGGDSKSAQGVHGHRSRSAGRRLRHNCSERTGTELVIERDLSELIDVRTRKGGPELQGRSWFRLALQRVQLLAGGDVPQVGRLARFVNRAERWNCTRPGQNLAVRRQGHVMRVRCRAP